MAERRRVLPLLAALLAVAISGCGGDDGPSRPEGIEFEAGSAIETGTPREDVAERLGEEPVLTAAATEGSGGCDYYAMRGQPLANVWEICFDEEDEVSQSRATFAPADQPPPPEDASPARAALIGVGDALCQADYRTLRKITNRVTDTLGEYEVFPTEPNREAVGEAIADFLRNIEHTRDRLAAFGAPSDGAEALEAYLGLLGEQIDTLNEARKAFLDEDLRTYNRSGNEFTELGESAEVNAAEYGFTICSASDFG